MKEALKYANEFKVNSLAVNFINWLFTINPIFPRFISEFYSSTYFRITEGIISIFQNSRTIRRVFSKRFPKELYDVIVKGEQTSFQSLLTPKLGSQKLSIWKCSATLADQLRTQSWQTKLIGVTIPHPSEMFRESLCSSDCFTPHVVAKKVPTSQRNPWTRGGMTPYLGSKTRESTSILQPWEKQIEIPLLKRANSLRKLISWFVQPKSNLELSIYANLQSLTGLDLKEDLAGFTRTGSSKHRLRCSRVSNEGNPGIGFNNLMYTTITTDALNEINEKNYDFMYQSVICWTGVLSVLPNSAFSNQETTHFHIKDLDCFREIEEEFLEVPYEYKFPDKSQSVQKMLTSKMEIKYSPKIFPKPHFMRLV